MIVMAAAFLVSLTVHEYSHGRAALAAGDNTAKLAGRLTLNPIAHLDLVGSIFFIIMMMTGLGIGWAKPVPVNPMRFKIPRWDNLKVSLWGPLSNILLAIGFALLRFGMISYAIKTGAVMVIQSYLFLFVDTCIRINLALALFNLIPIPPLDGSHILSSLLPTELARSFDMVIGRYGWLILMVIVFAFPGVLSGIIIEPMYKLYHILTIFPQLN